MGPGNVSGDALCKTWSQSRRLLYTLGFVGVLKKGPTPANLPRSDVASTQYQNNCLAVSPDQSDQWDDRSPVKEKRE
jgi:hypothetical protein